MIGAKVEVKRNESGSDALKQGLEESILDAADAGFEKSQQNISNGPTDTGKLLQSGIQPRQNRDGSVEWGYAAEYARYVEFGTAPHWPPIEPLKGWARRVLGDESLAYAVQKSIAENGTPAQPFFRPGVETMRRRLKSINIESRISDNL